MGGAGGVAPAKYVLASIPQLKKKKEKEKEE
jgi:hypothetical protein